LLTSVHPAFTCSDQALHLGSLRSKWRADVACEGSNFWRGTAVNRTPLRRAAAPAAIALSLAVVAAACGGDDDSGSSSGGESVSGSVSVSGSSTVAPISSLVAEEFQGENEGVDIAVDDPGTGDGFALFCDGQTDVSDASRPIEPGPEEVGLCKKNGIEYVELEIGFDGMSVMTNPNNEAVECLSFADLYALIGPEAEGFENWSDAQDLASELGSSTEFPDETLDLTGPGTESGTYDSFVEIALTPIAEEQGLPEDQLETTRPDYASSADDNVIVSNIEASDYSLGWVGFAFAENAGDSVKEIPVSADPDGECVEPSAETIADGSYPLSRSLYIYVNKAKAEQNEAVAAYVDYYLENLSEWVEGTGYVPLPEDQASETMSAWEGR
jgi:phosphate transport system substrate-binding protein